MPEDYGISINPQGDVIGIAVGDYNIQEGVFTKTSGDVANVVNEVPQSQPVDVPNTETLLTETQKRFEENDELSPEEKSLAQQHLKALESISEGTTKQVMEATSQEFLPNLA
ncbi:hypothetical protein [Iningainema tapete]|uniref:Uncharacterized protein n=1 Tax=Iningainema tapete BLCC-T55 TaxID=2748662 RepID=A0A8J6XII5_9CYAN|nr:hypothetical protein [Iningainema tapete]MBD2770857.1 hypothetical protein [Iningainema tapete BLCC-T55]